MTSLERARLRAEDYTYLLPDHWLPNEPHIWSVMHEAYVDRVVEIVRQSGARRVIEIGCGDGWNCGKLVTAGLDVVGVDWSRNGIEHARRMVPEAIFYCGDVTDERFVSRFPEPFDAMIMVEVLEHIEPGECLGAIRRLAQLLRIGGTFVLTTPSVNHPNDNPQHYRHFTEAMLRELIEDAGGLQVIGVEGYGDVVSERWHWRLARWVNNRMYTIHPIYRWLTRRHQAHCVDTPLERCHGLIATMRRTAEDAANAGAPANNLPRRGSTSVAPGAVLEPLQRPIANERPTPR